MLSYTYDLVLWVTRNEEENKQSLIQRDRYVSFA
jgi:hypothetical protein